MSYSVPGYTEISHFRAPYKDSMMGFGASEEAAPSSSASTPAQSAVVVETKPASSSVTVTPTAAAVPSAAAAVVEAAKASPSSAYTPVLPAKSVQDLKIVADKLAAEIAQTVPQLVGKKIDIDLAKVAPGMVKQKIAADLAKVAPAAVASKIAEQVAQAAPDLAGKRVALDISKIASLIAGQRAAVAATAKPLAPRRPLRDFRIPTPPSSAGAKVAQSFATKKLRPIPLNEAQANVRYFLGLLDQEANLQLRGPDPRLWPLKPAPSWDALWRAKIAILTNRKSRFHTIFKEQVAKLLRNKDPNDVKRLVPDLMRAIDASSIGFTNVGLQSIFAKAGLFKSNKELAEGPVSRVFPTKAEAEKHFASPKIQASDLQKLVGSSAANLLKAKKALIEAKQAAKAPVRQVSMLGLYAKVAIEDGLKADVAEQEKLFALQRRATAVKASIDLKRAKVALPSAEQKKLLEAVATSKKDIAKADADLKAALKKAEDGLAKAKDENAALRTSIEDLKSMVVKQETTPALVPVLPPPPPPPPVKQEADALPVPKTEDGKLPDPDKLAAKGDAAKDEKEIDDDIKAAGVKAEGESNYLPYLIGAGVLGALAFVAMQPKKSAT